MAIISGVGISSGISPETNRQNDSNQDPVSDVANKTFLILNELRGDETGLLQQIPGDLFPLINQELQNINKPARMPTNSEIEIADCLGEMRKYWKAPIGASEDQIIFDEIDIKMFAKWASEKRLSHIELPFSDDVEFKKLIPHLTHITFDNYFSGFDLSNYCTGSPLRETHLKNITHLTNLTSLIIKDCEEVTDAGFLDIASFPKLTSLGILGCKKVQSASLQHFSRLKALKVYNCLTWANEDCANIKNLTNLTSLDLSESTKVQNAGIQYITGLGRSGNG